jgi:8-oxo-dGTP diphosphatase
MNSKRGPLLVAAGLITHGNRILVGQRRRGDRHAFKWEFPGGKVEPGETPQQALVRELREELNIEATVGPEVARYVHNYPSGTTVQLLFYAVTTFRGEPDSRAFEQISWEVLERLPEIDFLDGDLDFVRRLANGEFRATLNPTANGASQIT